jgi:hypothetical protein
MVKTYFPLKEESGVKVEKCLGSVMATLISLKKDLELRTFRAKQAVY